MTQSIWQVRGREPELSCDIAVAGAGITGCSTAYWISRMQPHREVLLIDAGRVASGASGKNAGFLLQGALSDYLKDLAAFGENRARKIWRFTRENRDLIFDELDGAGFELESSGSVVAAGSEEENERLRECVGYMRSIGAASMHFSASETNRRLGSNGFIGSLHVPSGAMLNPVSLVRAIAKKSGAGVCEQARIRAIEQGSNGVTIDTERCIVRADRIVLAVNAWSPTLFPSLKRYVRPVRAQMYSTAPLKRRWLDVPVYSHDGYYYARQTKNGAFMAGGARHLHAEGEVGYDDAVTDAVQADIEAYVRTHFPKASAVPVEHRWSGVMGFSPDHLPIVGELPGIQGSIWTGGFSGHGMAYGFRFGRMLAEMLLQQDRPSGLDLFTADRFLDAPTRRAASMS